MDDEQNKIILNKLIRWFEMKWNYLFRKHLHIDNVKVGTWAIFYVQVKLKIDKLRLVKVFISGKKDMLGISLLFKQF